MFDLVCRPHSGVFVLEYTTHEVSSLFMLQPAKPRNERETVFCVRANENFVYIVLVGSM
jgi:hypothetical protein